MLSCRRTACVLILLTLLTLASLLVALSIGSLSLTFMQIVEAIKSGWTASVNNDTASTASRVVWELRLPRALAAFACGGLLAISGALMQALLRNPLADPYVLGVSGGAGVGALVAMLFGLGSVLSPACAFIGALVAMLLVFGLAHGDGSWTQTRLLLTGVVVASGCSAIVALILTLAPERQIHSMLFWLMGDLSAATEVAPALIALVLALMLMLPFARDLNLVARGELEAEALGVAAGRLRRLIYVVSSLATAVAVATAGTIGFIGLIVPHFLRLALGAGMGSDYRLLLPASALAGGSLLLLADTLARSIVAPLQLPVGALTALIGVPAFLILLSRGKPL